MDNSIANKEHMRSLGKKILEEGTITSSSRTIKGDLWEYTYIGLCGNKSFEIKCINGDPIHIDIKQEFKPLPLWDGWGRPSKQYVEKFFKTIDMPNLKMNVPKVGIKVSPPDQRERQYTKISKGIKF